jgi:exodeoxyribonuclease VII large subunit
VTSSQAAALQDILNILQRRHHTANVLIYPVQVQGDAAPNEISAGIRWFNKARTVEVIIVARGGGSIEDLSAFNHEGLARAVSQSQIPVISAVGHETDFTIIDFVSDLRAPTPSAAAELVIRSRQEIENTSEALRERLARAMRYRLLMARQALAELAQHGAFARIMDSLGRRQQRLDELAYRLETALRRLLEQHRRRWEFAAAAVRYYDVRQRLRAIEEQLESRTAALAAAFRNALLERKSQLERLAGSLQALSPLAILERGYALVFDSSGKLIKDPDAVRAGDDISARVAKGEIRAVVKEKRA